MKYDFDDAKEDGNYSIIPELKAAVTGYKPSVIKIGGVAVSGSTGGTTEGGNGEGEGESGTTNPPLSGDINKVEFKSGTYPAGISVNGNYNSKTGYLKMESATLVTVTLGADKTITIHTNTPSKNIKVNGEKVKTDGSGEVKVTVKANETLTIEKGDSMDLEYIVIS